MSLTDRLTMFALFLGTLAAIWLWVHRAKKPAPWVDIPGDPLTLAHREILAEVMRRKLAGTLAEMDRRDIDGIFLRVKAETTPAPETPPREAHRLITSLPLTGRTEELLPDKPRLILTRGGR